MTKQQFLDGFFILYNEVADLSAPGYEPIQIAIIASKVQEDLIISKYGPKSNRLQEGFEESEKRIQDLGELVKYKTYSVFTPGFFANSVEIVLPNTLVTSGPTDYSDVHWFTIYEDAKSNVLDCTIPNNTTVFVLPDVIETPHGEVKVAKRDPFRKPYVKANKGKVLRVRAAGRKYFLITDGNFSITEYKIGYISKPAPIDLLTSLTSQVSGLSDQFHRELLDATVSQCLKITEQTQKFGVDLQIPKE